MSDDRCCASEEARLSPPLLERSLPSHHLPHSDPECLSTVRSMAIANMLPSPHINRQENQDESYPEGGSAEFRGWRERYDSTKPLLPIASSSSEDRELTLPMMALVRERERPEGAVSAAALSLSNTVSDMGTSTRSRGQSSSPPCGAQDTTSQASGPGRFSAEYQEQRRQRNERERVRWRKISDAFRDLKLCLPCREYEELPQLNTLKRAIRYIQFLGECLETGRCDEQSAARVCLDDDESGLPDHDVAPAPYMAVEDRSFSRTQELRRQPAMPHRPPGLSGAESCSEMMKGLGLTCTKDSGSRKGYDGNVLTGRENSSSQRDCFLACSACHRDMHVSCLDGVAEKHPDLLSGRRSPQRLDQNHNPSGVRASGGHWKLSGNRTLTCPLCNNVRYRFRYAYRVEDEENVRPRHPGTKRRPKLQASSASHGSGDGSATGYGRRPDSPSSSHNLPVSYSVEGGEAGRWGVVGGDSGSASRQHPSPALYSPTYAPRPVAYLPSATAFCPRVMAISPMDTRPSFVTNSQPPRQPIPGPMSLSSLHLQQSSGENYRPILLTSQARAGDTPELPSKEEGPSSTGVVAGSSSRKLACSEPPRLEPASDSAARAHDSPVSRARPSQGPDACRAGTATSRDQNKAIQPATPARHFPDFKRLAAYTVRNPQWRDAGDLLTRGKTAEELSAKFNESFTQFIVKFQTGPNSLPSLCSGSPNKVLHRLHGVEPSSRPTAEDYQIFPSPQLTNDSRTESVASGRQTSSPRKESAAADTFQAGAGAKTHSQASPLPERKQHPAPVNQSPQRMPTPVAANMVAVKAEGASPNLGQMVMPTQGYYPMYTMRYQPTVIPPQPVPVFYQVAAAASQQGVQVMPVYQSPQSRVQQATAAAAGTVEYFPQAFHHQAPLLPPPTHTSEREDRSPSRTKQPLHKPEGHQPRGAAEHFMEQQQTTPVASSQPNVCAVCRRPSQFLCSSCKRFAYCSRQCQAIGTTRFCLDCKA